jgi:hypothetical protein
VAEYSYVSIAMRRKMRSRTSATTGAANTGDAFCQ